MIVRPWEPGDTENLNLQQAQAYMEGFLDDVDLEPLSIQGMAWSAEVGSQIVAIGGILPIWNNRGQAWMLVSPEAGSHMMAVHRAVARVIVRCPLKRIEATVDVDFEPGRRWMKMLGFELEGYMKAYRPDGADMLLYARVTE